MCSNPMPRLPILLVAPLLAARLPGQEVLLESAAGEVSRRALEGLDTRDPRQLGAHLVRFEGLRPPARAPAGEDDVEVLLHGGDRLHGRVAGGRAELLDVELWAGVRMGVAVDEILEIVFPLRIPVLSSATVARGVDGDRLFRRSGGQLDRIDGAVEEFTTDGVRFGGDRTGSRLFPWSEVAALFVESTGVAPRPRGSEDVDVVLDLHDHGRLRGRLVRLGPQGCELTTRNGDRVLVPLAAIAHLLVDDGTLAFLSSFPPAGGSPSRPFGDDLGMSWPARVDRAVAGGPLAAGGRVYPRGIGMHAPGRRTWMLEPGWKALRGFVAVDDSVLRLPARGSVVFRVLLDGVERWRSPVVRGGEGPLPLPELDLAGARELALEVGDAGDSAVADRAAWLQLLLRR